MCDIFGGRSPVYVSACSLPRPVSNGMRSIYITVDFFYWDVVFGAERRAYLEFVQAARPAEAGGEVLLPGETEQRYRAKRLAEGVPLPDDTWKGIAATALELGIPQAVLDAMVR